MPDDRYYDDLPPPKGSPRLMGDKLAGLSRFRRTADYRRSGSPARADAHLSHRNLIILLAIKAGLTQAQVARVFGITQQGVSCVVRSMEDLAMKPFETDDDA